MSWSSEGDVTQLAYLTRRAIGRACQHRRALLGEVADELSHTHDHRSPDLIHAALAVGLVTRIRDIAREGDSV